MVVAGRAEPLEDECRRLLKIVQQRCPGLLAPPPVTPGGTIHPIDITDDEVSGAVRAALRLGADLGPDESVVVWTAGEAEIAVHVDATRVLVGDGVVVVEMTVETDQTGRVQVVVPFSVGTPRRPAGMVAVTESAPRGPDLIVRLWGNALIAAAWDAVMRATARLASLAGRDIDGQALLPGAMIASGAGLSVIPQARHEVDRPPGPRVRPA